ASRARRRGDRMIGRRSFIMGLGGATAAASLAWPRAARAQQSGLPVIGLLDSRSPETLADRLRGVRQGLKDAGYIEGENVAIVYRWAENELDLLPAVAVHRVHA